MSQEVIEITEREIEVIEVVEKGPAGPVGPQANINYTVVSSPQTLSNSQNIAADTSGGSFTLTLPANPNAGDSIDIFDYSETFDTNPLTIARNGENIESIAEDLICNVEGAYFTMIYTGSTRGWQILPRYGTTGGGGESVLTTEGDMVYRGAAINERLPIGSAGQILKVNSGGNAPEWGAAPATGVTSVGVTGSDGIEVDSGSPVTGSGTIALGVNAATLRSHINVADGANNYTHPNHSGEVTSSGDGATTIANDVVTNAKLANVATATIKGRATEGTGDPEDLTASQVRTILNVADGAEVNVQSNWTEADSGSDAFILNKPTLGTAATADIGTGAGDVCAGDDARLSDSRTPTSHAASHATGGSDALALAASQLTSGTLDIARIPTGTGSTQVALGDHTHTQLHDKSHTMTDATSHTAGNHKVFYSDGSGQIQELALGNSGEVLTSNGASAAPSFAAASGGVTAVGASTADVLSVSGSDLIADDGGIIDSADPFIKWDDTAGKLVYANPLSRPSGAFYVGLAPTTTALGSNAINIQAARAGGNQVAGGQNSVVVGNQLRCEGSASIGIGYGGTSQNNANCVGVGATHSCYAASSTAIGNGATANSVNSTAIGNSVVASGRGAFATRPFASVYWGGQTTNDTPLILNLDATATNRFTIAANTALIADIFLIARSSDNTKFLSARRSVAIYRDNANVTALIGDVQTLGNDQSVGSPTWSIAITADDTNEALQLEVTGATGETVNWRATAFYRVV